MSGNTYKADGALYPLGPPVPVHPTEINMITFALMREMTERQEQALNEDKQLGQASKRYSRGDILYALEKYAPKFRCRFLSERFSEHMESRSSKSKESIDPYLLKLEKEGVLEKSGDVWIFIPPSEYE